ncbi:putative phosphoinositide phosphatase SAC9 isoform X2 [Wolffia australiana]
MSLSAYPHGMTPKLYTLILQLELCNTKRRLGAILGYAILGNLGLLLVAKKLEATIPSLPSGECVFTVSESQWIRVQLQYAHPQGKGELKNIQELTDIDIDGNYYFCETRDITRPFPSRMPFGNPDSEFVWNEFLSKPFKDIGLPSHCVCLLQGFAESRSFEMTGQKGGVVALLARRSRLHPGTRYLARGLNASFSTGNEVECEQLVWVLQESAQTVPFSSYIWRRGTIPLWWGAELKMTAAEAEIYVSSQDPYRGSAEYYQRLSKRYGIRNSSLMTGSSNKKNSMVPIMCINLLRRGEGKSEDILVKHFVECLNYIKLSGKLPFTQLYIQNFDWHTNVKLKGEQETIEDLWKHLKTPTIGIGLCEGEYSKSLQHLSRFKGGLIIHNEDINGAFHLSGLQNGVIRFNCADSLDRTNAASYFGCLQVFVEQCRRLRISIETEALSTFGSTSSASLPPGWAQYTHTETGRIYYVNHKTRTTTWEHPCAEKSWKMFDMTFDQFKNSMMLSPIKKLSELFLLAGDIHATLYTGSKAMHSQILNIFNDDTGKFKQFAAAQNMKITLQRRYKNVIVDGSRQKQLEMFLGIRMFKHLPSLPSYPLQVLTRPPACFLKSLSNIFPGLKDEPNPLSFKKKEQTWMSSPHSDAVELLIYLKEPCHVCELLLTISHGGDDSLFPGTLDVRIGCNLDSLDLSLKGASLPRCANGTNIIIPLAGPMTDADLAVARINSSFNEQGDPYLPLLYTFEEAEGNLNFLTRIVVLTFYPSTSETIPVSLGEVEVLGASLPWRRMFQKNGEGLKFGEEIRRHQEAVKSFLLEPSIEQNSNPFLEPDISSDGCVSYGDQLNVVDSGIDLLTGDPVHLQLTLHSDPEVAKSTQLFDDDWSDLLVIPSPEPGKKDDAKGEGMSTECNSSGVHHYLNRFKSVLDTGHNLVFEDALKLEISRLKAGVSAAERDRALRYLEIDPATVDPNRFLNDFDLIKISRLSDTLSLLGHSLAEDKALASIGLDIADHDAIDFWNLNLGRNGCLGSGCEVHCEEQFTEKPSSVKASTYLCFFCGKRACQVCCAGKGASLLASYISRESRRVSGSSSQSGSSHGSRGGSSPFPITQDGFICKMCCSEEIRYALYVDYARTLISLRRRSRADSAAQGALSQIIGSQTERTPDSRQWLRNFLNGEDSLAEFPGATFLNSVETDVDSEPLLSLLCPIQLGSCHSYWRAPRGCSHVEFPIILEDISDVSGVLLLVSSCGYSPPFDLPLINIWSGDKINKEDRSFVGKWNMQSLTGVTELSGPENPHKGSPRHATFNFQSPIRCRILWITFTLQETGSSSVNLERDCSLLSLDDHYPLPLASRSLTRDTGGNDPHIHARRLIVFGKLLKKEQRNDPSNGFGNTSANPWLERLPTQGRFRIPVERERLTGNDLILEQYLSPTTPPLAGFRLDAFNVIKRRITHSPSPVDMAKWDPFFNFLEDSNICPPVLYIHVSVILGNGVRAKLGEYRLPQAVMGTAMYFDFSRSIQAQVVIFKLSGDVTAFIDEPADQDDFQPLASGLALSSNRVRLYYYGDPAQLGKLASLSAI